MTQLTARRLQLAETAALLAFAVQVAFAQLNAATVAPSGTLRAAFLGANPVHATMNPQTKEWTGPAPDLIREMGRRFKTPVSLLPMANAAAVIDIVVAGTADIGFLAYETGRASKVDFSESYAVMQNAYLVRADSPIKQSSDVDRAGITVAAAKGQSQEIFVSSTFKNARVEVLEVMPQPDAIRKMLASGKVNVFAANRARMEGVATGFPEVRVLPDSFLVLGQAIVVPKGNAARLKIVNDFIVDVRRAGFVKSSIHRSGVSGLEAAP